MVNQLHHLEALIVCDALEMNGDFGKLVSHPSLQTIKLMSCKSTDKAFTSALRLCQLQELWIEDLVDTAYGPQKLWIEDLVDTAYGPHVVSSPPPPPPRLSQAQPANQFKDGVMFLQARVCHSVCWHNYYQLMMYRVQGASLRVF